MIMMKRATPKRVTIPNNGRTFVTRYERVTHNHLPANIRLRDLTNKEQRHVVNVVKDHNVFNKVEV